MSIIIGRQTIYVQRWVTDDPTVGYWDVDGFYKSGPAPDFSAADTFSGSPQPLNDRDLDVLPEGLRRKEAIKIYTEEVLRTGINPRFSSDPSLTLSPPATPDNGSRMPDLIVFDGEVYAVYSVRNYNKLTPLTHYRALCVLLDASMVDQYYEGST